MKCLFNGIHEIASLVQARHDRSVRQLADASASTLPKVQHYGCMFCWANNSAV
jgi:hypothetical protein